MHGEPSRRFSAAERMPIAVVKARPANPAAMVIVKIILVLVALIASLVLLQQQHTFQRIGITGNCTEIQAPVPDVAGSQWWSCTEGLLTGYPTLVKDSCALKVKTAKREVWRCPYEIERPASLI